MASSDGGVHNKDTVAKKNTKPKDMSCIISILDGHAFCNLVENPEAKRRLMRILDYINKNVSNYFEHGLEVEKEVPTMNNSRGGDFTRNLLSLQLQFQTLLEGVGGETTASLLDGLAQLSESERQKVVPSLSHVILRIAKGDKRLISASDQELQEFEDSLFDSIMSALGHSANDDAVDKGQTNTAPLQVLPGGKRKRKPVLANRRAQSPSLIDLAKARAQRRHKFDSPPPPDAS